MNNIEPWCISRQLWWGHQIPAWYGPDKKIFVATNEKDAKRQAKRISGLCNIRMFDDAEPILESLDTYVYNRSNEISMFRSSEGAISQMNQISLDIRNQCEQEFKRELAEIDAARRARLEALRRKQAQQRAALAARRARLAEAERLKRRESFDMLASF